MQHADTIHTIFLALMHVDFDKDLIRTSTNIAYCSNQNGIKSALEGKMAQKIKGRITNMLTEVMQKRQKPSCCFVMCTAPHSIWQRTQLSPLGTAQGSQSNVSFHTCNSVQAAVPAQILLATGVDQYRKPEKGMWDYFVEHGNDGKQPGAASAVLMLLTKRSGWSALAFFW